MRTVAAVAVLAAVLTGTAGGADDAVRLRARAALALAFAAAGRPPGYAERYAEAVRAGVPLVVWVGQPAGDVPGCLSVRCEAFPGAASVAVVVGLPDGDRLRRIDLPGRPTPDAVRAVVR
jgi:hypothetical protein